MKPILCLLFFVIATSLARAELGETLEQYTARYGQPVDKKPASNVDEMVYFKKDAIRIAAGLKGSKCVLLILGNESGERLTDEQVESLLKENAGGVLWKKSTKPSGNMVWIRSDNFAVAQFSSLNGILTLVTTEYMQGQMARKASEAGMENGG